MHKQPGLPKKLAIIFSIAAACLAAPYIEEASVVLSVGSASGKASFNRSDTYRQCDKMNVQPHAVSGILKDRWAGRYGWIPLESAQEKSRDLRREARAERGRANAEAALCAINDIIPFNGGIEDIFGP
jgi:hypothetical protein